jgi:hypothetical protein
MQLQQKLLLNNSRKLLLTHQLKQSQKYKEYIMEIQVPQHPGRGAPQAASQAPQRQSAANPYFAPSAALANYNGQLQVAQAQQAQAQAGKAQAEANVMRQAAQAQGLGNPVQAGPVVSPQEVQARQVADAIVNGQVGQEQLQAMIAQGKMDPAVAEAALGMAEQYMQQDQARNEQAMGLGAIQ